MAEEVRRIYMDHNATAPLAPEVLDAMLPYLKDNYGNSSSIHWFGRNARTGLDASREQMADFISANTTKEIIFTSGGTEADNHAVFGIASRRSVKGKHIITSSVEHEAVLEACNRLEKEGFDVTYLPVDKYGMVSAESVQNALRDDTILVTIMAANNEVGTINPIQEIGEILDGHQALFHTDAVQAAGKIPIDVNKWKVDLLSLAAHKIYGPKGVGMLYVRRGTPLDRFMIGGHHERKRRAGTENVPGIVGMAAATRLVAERMIEDSSRIGALRDRLQAGILENIEHVRLNGHPEKRTFNTVNTSFKFIEGEGILLNLDFKGIAASTGSACTSGDLAPSHVLLAMGVPISESHGAIRFSLGHSNTEEDIDHTVNVLKDVIPRLRSMSPLYDKFKRGEEIPDDPAGAHHHGHKASAGG